MEVLKKIEVRAVMFDFSSGNLELEWLDWFGGSIFDVCRGNI